MYGTIIIGAGAAGITAAIYAARAKLKFLINKKNDAEKRVDNMVEEWGFKENSLLSIMVLQNNGGLTFADACAEVGRLVPLTDT